MSQCSTNAGSNVVLWEHNGQPLVRATRLAGTLQSAPSELYFLFFMRWRRDESIDQKGLVSLCTKLFTV
jgi:hypothetical protein